MKEQYNAVRGMTVKKHQVHVLRQLYTLLSPQDGTEIQERGGKRVSAATQQKFGGAGAKLIKHFQTTCCGLHRYICTGT